MVGIHGEGYVEEEGQLPFIVGYVFARAVEEGRGGWGGMGGQGGQGQEGGILRDVADVMGRIIESDGGGDSESRMIERRVDEDEVGVED